MRVWILACAAAVRLFAQMPEGYLDVDVAKVKMGSRMDFDELNKKMKEMNRKNGDRWFAYEVVFGDSANVCFVESRSSYADAWNGMKAFEDAITRALGEHGMRAMFNQWDSLVESEHETLYRRRWDLSSNVPSNLAEYYKRVGQAHWVYVQTVHVRPDKSLDYEAALGRLKEARDRDGSDIGYWATTAVAGASPGTFRITALLKSLGDLDKTKTVRQVLGDGFSAYLSTVESSQIEIGRFIPELSHPPDEAVAADPDFWQPKAAAPAKPKASPKP